MKYDNDQQSVWDALESWVEPKDRTLCNPRITPNKQEIKNARAHLMRFLDELDCELTVGEIRLYLEDYE